eukprot:1424966-Rhodomonas_salina.6
MPVPDIAGQGTPYARPVQGFAEHTRKKQKKHTLRQYRASRENGGVARLQLLCRLAQRLRYISTGLRIGAAYVSTVLRLGTVYVSTGLRIGGAYVGTGQRIASPRAYALGTSLAAV